MKSITLNQTALCSPTEGCDLAEELITSINSKESVQIDFSNVERITPSFSNALIMTLIEKAGDVETVRKFCHFVNRSQRIIGAMNKSVIRYQAGIRLTTQRISAAS